MREVYKVGNKYIALHSSGVSKNNEQQRVKNPGHSRGFLTAHIFQMATSYYLQTDAFVWKS